MHISYSGIENYNNRCPFNFKLRYIDKITLERGSIFTAFGSAIHFCIENLINNRDANVESVFKNEFKKNLKELPLKIKKDIINDSKTKELFSDMFSKGSNLCVLAVDYLKTKFKSFQLIGTEIEILEPLTDCFKNDLNFKGVIDVIIQTEDGVYHIIDWKSTTWGWKAEKKNNKWTTYQLTYYKHFFGLQKNIKLDNIKTYFALIKRTAPSNKIEFVNVPIGEKKIKNALKVLDNTLVNIDKGFYPKNKTYCDSCEYYKTQYCDAR